MSNEDPVSNYFFTSDDGTISVDNNFVRFQSKAISVSEIKSIILNSDRPDGCVVPVLLAFLSVAFLIWIVAPIANAFMLIFIILLSFAAFNKHRNPSAENYMLVIRTSGLIPTHVHQTTDKRSVDLLRDAIEKAMRSRAS